MVATHYRAFGSLFFLLHQDRLLWLLNAPVIGRWFRWVLRISGKSSSVGYRNIWKILPNAIFWWDGPNQKAEFRTHAKFSKRLYYAFAPIWWTLHAWDWCVADRWMPELSFGFSTLTAYPDADPETATVDGVAGQGNVSAGVTWATLRDGAGNESSDTDASEAAAYIKCGTTSNQYREIVRGFFLFDTSALTAAATKSAAVMSLFGVSKQDDGSWSPNIDVYLSTPASNTAIVNADYQQIGTISQTGSPIAYASWSTSGYNPFPFDATGIENVNTIGISKYGTRNANFDVANTPPTWGSGSQFAFICYYADQTGTANDPKLVVTYGIATTFSQSSVISSVTLTTASIARTPAADGSDLWTPVESDDGNLYATYGDGSGFGGDGVTDKTEWGLARIEGNYAGRAGYNVYGGHLPEQSGTPIQSSGSSPGIKCENMISVGGVLYLMLFDWGYLGSDVWSAKVVKTANKGASWQQSGGGAPDNTTWQWDGIAVGGYAIGWIQCGADYGDAPDSSYIYGYSYPILTTADLAEFFACRVAVANVMDPASYEYRQSDGSWGAFATAEPMFTQMFIGGDVRAWYHPGLNLYFMTIPYGTGPDWIWLDAPNPWGPWTKVGQFTSWIDGQYKFGFVAPAKWNSGNDFALVFSGVDNGQIYDQFCTVPGYFTLTATGGGLISLSDDISIWQGVSGTNFLRYLSEVLGLTDTRNILKSMIRRPTESLGLTDSQVKKLAKVLSEILGVTDEERKKIAKILSESLGATDFRNIIRLMDRDLSDGIGLTDSQVKSIQKRLTELVGASDARIILYTIGRILSDSIGLTDIQRKMMAKIIADSLSLSDAISKIKLMVRNLSEVEGMTDSNAFLLQKIARLADSIGLSDSHLKISQLVRAVSDSLALNDILDRHISLIRTVADSGNISDSQNRQLLVVKRLTETLGLTDLESYSFVKYLNISDVLGISDAHIRSFLKLISDTLGLTDSNQRQMAIKRILSDTDGISDSIIKSIAKTISEALGISDSTTRYRIIQKVISDSLGLTDYQYRTIVKIFSLSDNLGLTDGQVKLLAKVIGESLGLSDSQFRSLSYIRAMTEGLNNSDFVIRAWGAKRESTEAIGLTDAEVQYLAQIISRILSEPVGITNAYPAIFSAVRAIAESLGLTDIQIQKLEINRIVADALSFADSAPRSVNIIRRSTESVALSDSLSALRSKLLSIANNIGLTDAQIKKLGYVRTLSEAEGVVDFLLRAVAAKRNVFDPIDISDNLRRILSYLHVQSESVGVTDSIVWQKVLVRILTESVSLSDSEFRAMLYWIHQYDVVGLADGQFRSVSYQRFLSDLLNVLDSLGLEEATTASIRRRIMMQMRRH